ncbi:alpha/beta fold hydrolase [Humitalea sp. 24SJ18S-53]|uniref:alpha/beta fold hydrolase n=1 Tax=Humitalea sp. 24SJ18S-53 TaxID=3422307 RepID=UPI003D67C601
MIEAGQGRAVLLLHGIGGRACLWQPTLDALAPRARAVAWDMPGYDGGAVLDPMSFGTLAAAAVTLLDRLGIARADVVGHSMGGMVAIEMGIAHPDRVRSLCLAATSAAFGGKDAAFRDAFLAARQKPLEEGRGMAGVAADLVPGMAGPAADPAAVPAAQAAMATVPEPAYRAALACLTGFDRRADLSRITAPTLVLAGEADATAPPRGMARLAEAILGARFAVIPGAGHLLPLEAPDAFHAALLRFLDSVPA